MSNAEYSFATIVASEKLLVTWAEKEAHSYAATYVGKKFPSSTPPTWITKQSKNTAYALNANGKKENI